MGWFDSFRWGKTDSLEKTVGVLVERVQQQDEIIKTLTSYIEENREYIQNALDDLQEQREAISVAENEILEHRDSITELGTISTFVIQQQNEIASHIMLTENLRKGKIVPGMINISNDDDLIN